MKKRFTLLALILSMYWVGTLAQSTQPCDLMLVPEGDNLCILEKRANDFSVVRACRGNTVTYRAYSPTAVSYEWTVEGGVIQSYNSDQTECSVTWGDSYGGMISVTATRENGTECTSVIQIVLLDKPKCVVASMPDYVQVDDNYKFIEVCVGDTLSFVDHSIAGEIPIVDYYWELQEPTGNNRVSNSASFSYVPTEPGTYNLSHLVYNECGCYDEVVIEIRVNEQCPLELSCFGTVCKNSVAKYYIYKPYVENNQWIVEGGQLLESSGQSVTILWEAPASGYGTFSFFPREIDCECKSMKTIRIPVISDNVPISGPDTICIGEDYEFSLPLWGSTWYSWEVNHPSGVTMGENNNIVRINASYEDVIRLSATFKCDFLECGEFTVVKDIVVKPVLTIDPMQDEVCAGKDVTFTTTPSDVCLWSVKKNNELIYTTQDQILTYQFPESGVYMVYAQSDNYCRVASLAVNVRECPPAPYNIKGPKVMCPHYTGTYSAMTTSPDCYILWKWTADGVTHSYAGDKVNITFGSVLSNIRVSQVDRVTGCESYEVVYHITELQPAPWPYNDTIRICQGQQRVLSSLIDQSDDAMLYEWKVVPSNVIAIQGSNMDATVTLLGNYTSNNPDYAKIILKREYCDNVRYDTVDAVVGEIDSPQITHGEICKGRTSYFNLSYQEASEADRNQTYWYVENDDNSRKYGASFSYTFNDTTDHVVHLVYVSKYGCTAESQITVYAHTCPNSGTGGTSGSTGSCTRVPNAFRVYKNCYNIVTIGGFLHNSGLRYPLHLLVYRNINGNSGVYPAIVDTIVYGSSQHVVVPATGDCSFYVEWNVNDSCYYYDTVVNVTRPTYKIYNDCSGNLVVFAERGTKVNVNGHERIVPPFASRYDTVMFPISPLVTPDIRDRIVNIRLTFQGRDCYIDTVFNVSSPNISRINIESTMCEKTSFVFSANASGNGLTYHWTFGDGSSNNGNGIKHVYDYGSTYFTFMGHQIHVPYATVTLKVTDRSGCTATKSTRVLIIPDNTDSLSLDATYIPTCPIDSIEMTATPGAFSYNWNYYTSVNGNVAYDNQSGTHIVDITTTPGKCRKKLKLNVAYPNAPSAYIVCDSFYCWDDVAKLRGDMGSNYFYNWTITTGTNNHLYCTDANPNVQLQDTGLYHLVLVVSDGNCSDTATASFYVHPLPLAPSLELCGNPCITEGPVQVCSSNGSKLLWSNGARAASTEYYSDGQISAYYVDPVSGCKSPVGSILIPEAPDFSGLLTGCYCLPEDRIPDHISVYSLGVPQTLNLEWYNYDNMIAGDQLIPPSPVDLPIEPDGGEYHLFVPDYDGYGYGCQATSPQLTIMNCSGGGSGGGVFFPSIEYKIIDVKCNRDGCNLYYDVDVDICNITYNPIEIANITSLFPVLSWEQIIPSGGSIPFGNFTLNPDECISLRIRVQYNYSSTNTVNIIVEGVEEPLGVISINLNEYLGFARDCFEFDECSVEIDDFFMSPNDLSLENQALFFDFGFALPPSVDNVLAVWCDQGSIIDPYFDGTYYGGLLMLGFGRTTQLAAADSVFCFHVVCCSGGSKFCQFTICVPYSAILDSYYGWTPLTGRDGRKSILSRQNQLLQNYQKAYRLEPNPSTNIVRVRDINGDGPADGIVLIEVFSIHGQKVMSIDASSQFDVSKLASGTYIVKVLNDDNTYEYLKLVKK